jgi:hypothetical protein
MLVYGFAFGWGAFTILLAVVSEAVRFPESFVLGVLGFVCVAVGSAGLASL